MDNAFDEGMETIIQQKYGESDMNAITDSVNLMQQQVKFRTAITIFLDNWIPFLMQMKFIQNRLLDNACQFSPPLSAGERLAQ